MRLRKTSTSSSGSLSRLHFTLPWFLQYVSPTRILTNAQVSYYTPLVRVYSEDFPPLKPIPPMTKKKNTHLPLPDPLPFSSLPRRRPTRHLRLMRAHILLGQSRALLLMRLEVRFLAITIAVVHAMALETLLE